MQFKKTLFVILAVSAGLLTINGCTTTGSNSAPNTASETTAYNFNRTGEVCDFETSLDNALTLCEKAQRLWERGDVDEAISSLDLAYNAILNIDDCEDPELMQQKEDMRYLISKRILEIYASRQTAVKGTSDAIPIVINADVQREIDLFTTGREQNFFRESYRRSGQYRAYIVQEFEKAGIPTELSWLPLIESGFKTQALSSARALGPWQFIPSTGYKFGLNRDDFIDDRMDPIKSTHAAIGYLKELHGMFGDWMTALAAYNCGEGRVARVIRTQNVNYLDNFWDLYSQLPNETARYVPRFLATLHVINNVEKYGLDKVQLDDPWQYDTVTTNKQVSLQDLAKALNVSSAELAELNPQLRHQILPPTPFNLRVPAGMKTSFDNAIASIDVTQLPTNLASNNKSGGSTSSPGYVYHTIKSGETLSTIANKYKTTTAAIMKLNGMKKTTIVAGQKIKIPTGNVSYAQSTTASNNTNKSSSTTAVSSGGTYTVKKGDTLGVIAQQHGVTVKALQAANNMTGTNLKIGQKLVIPGKGGTATTTVASSGGNKSGGAKALTNYKVKSGDSPYSIARSHNMQLSRFLAINNLTPKSVIKPGQVVKVE